MPGSAEQAQTLFLSRFLLAASGPVPIRAFALRTHARLVLYVARYPFVLASFAAKAPCLDLYFCHSPIYLENNIPVKYEFACTCIYFISNILRSSYDTRRLLWKNVNLKRYRSLLNRNSPGREIFGLCHRKPDTANTRLMSILNSSIALAPITISQGQGA